MHYKILMMILIRLLSILFLVFTPVAMVFGIAFGISGLWIAVVSALVTVTLGAFLAPQILELLQPGVHRTLVMRDTKYPVMVSPEPSANILVVRSPFPGSAKIHVSQGALNLLSREELGEVLAQASEFSRSRELITQSLSAVIASVVCLVLSREWLNATMLGKMANTSNDPMRLSLSTLGFAILFSWCRLMIRVGGYQAPSPMTGTSQVILNNALRKMCEENFRWPFQGPMGAPRLYLVHPWEGRGFLAF